jgi:hypothetical protein
LLAPFSVNQRFPSGPLAIDRGSLPAVGIENSVTTPESVMRPILPALSSVNQMFPSGPAAIPSPSPLIGYSVKDWPCITPASATPTSAKPEIRRNAEARQLPPNPPVPLDIHHSLF